MIVRPIWEQITEGRVPSSDGTRPLADSASWATSTSDFWDALTEYDARALVDLSPLQRRQQLLARWTLYTYLDDLREEAEWGGLAPPVLADGDSLPSLRELGDYLVAAVTMQELGPEELGQQPPTCEEKSLAQQ